MKSLQRLAFGTAPLLVAGVALAQNGGMMDGNGGMWGDGWMGGYGGAWLPVLLVVAAVGLVAWFIKQKGK